jgi:hypothetical protein
VALSAVHPVGSRARRHGPLRARRTGVPPGTSADDIIACMRTQDVATGQPAASRRTTSLIGLRLTPKLAAMSVSRNQLPTSW